MALKDILVHVDNTPAGASRLDTAIALASAHDAHLIGLYVAARPQIPGYVGARIPESLLLEQRRHPRGERRSAAAGRAKLVVVVSVNPKTADDERGHGETPKADILPAPGAPR